jgi:hypothetical protein
MATSNKVRKVYKMHPLLIYLRYLPYILFSNKLENHHILIKHMSLFIPFRALHITMLL